MIALSCSRCGHSIEIIDSMRGQSVRCARCGTTLSPVLPVSAPQTELGMPILESFTDEVNLADHADLTMTNQNSQDETQKPNASNRTAHFPFLSPAKGPHELGWLGHYRVIRLLGQGGMGIVFEAIDTHL